MNMMKRIKSVVALAMLLSAGVANAGLYQFDLTGDYTASWQLDSTPQPSLGFSGQGFFVEDVQGRFQGSDADRAGIWFFNERLGGGLQIDAYDRPAYLLITDGPQLYTGTESNPTFRLGTFAMTEFPRSASGRYSLTVTDLDAGPGPADVPEPATGAMLLGGLGLLYASMKRRIGK
jgi:hypothetical protein